MATINPSFVQQNNVYQNSPAGATDQAKTAEQAGPAQPPALPFVFVNGEPPADAGLVPPATYTAGLALPAVDPRKWSAQAGSLDLSNVTTTSGVMNVQAQVMALQDVMMKLMLTLRTSALNDRETELQTMIKQKTLGIEKGLEAAEKEMWAGIITGVGQMFQGVAGMKGGLNGETNGGKFTSAGTFMNGMYSVAAAAVNYQAAGLRAEQQRYDLRADVANTRSQQNNELANNFKEAFKVFMDGQLQIQRDLTESAKRTFV